MLKLQFEKLSLKKAKKRKKKEKQKKKKQKRMNNQLHRNQKRFYDKVMRQEKSGCGHQVIAPKPKPKKKPAIQTQVLFRGEGLSLDQKDFNLPKWQKAEQLHARKRMGERDVSLEDIEKLKSKVIPKIQITKGNMRLVYEGKIRGRVLHYVENRDTSTKITAYWKNRN